MKSIRKNLISLIIISIYFLSSTYNSNNVNSQRMKEDPVDEKVEFGGGSWADGYDCPRMKITTLSDGKFFDTKEWRFEPAKMDKWYDGLEIEFTPQNSIEKEIFIRNSADGKIYIPWRYMDMNDVEYEKPLGKNKRINIKVITDMNNQYKVSLIFPKRRGQQVFISSEECKNLIKKFRDEIAKEVNLIKTDKRLIQSYTQDLKILLNNKKLIKKDAEQIKKQAKKDNIKIEKSFEQQLAQLKMLMLQIDTKLKSFDEVTLKRDILNRDIVNLSNEIENDSEIMDQAIRNEIIKGSKEEMAELREKILEEFDIISDIANDRFSLKNINEAKNDIFAQDLQGMEDALKRIYSS